VDFDLDVEGLIGSVVTGALTGRRKRMRGVQRLLGRRGGLLNAGTLLALAGVAWGVYESVVKKTTAADGVGPGDPPQPARSTTPAAPDRPVGELVAPRAVLPGVSPTPAVPVPAPSSGAVPDGVLRVIRLTLSAARADGTLTDAERQSILAQARRARVEAIIERELDAPRPLAEILAGVTDAGQRSDLYTLAFAIVRADEAVTGSERVYLAQLAYQLGLDPEATARLEAEAARRIDEAAREA
jgi:uncharacterized membrane protein YebE (DUF533 family)